MLRVLPFIILLAVVIWALVWFFVGRRPRSQRGAGRAPAAPRGPAAPDDDPEFLARLNREKEQEQRIRELERRLAELDDDEPPA